MKLKDLRKIINNIPNSKDECEVVINTEAGTFGIDKMVEINYIIGDFDEIEFIEEEIDNKENRKIGFLIE